MFGRVFFVLLYRSLFSCGISEPPLEQNEQEHETGRVAFLVAVFLNYPHIHCVCVSIFVCVYFELPSLIN